MPRPPGIKKTGGRKKGTPNKRTDVLLDSLTELGLDVPGRIVELLPYLEESKQVDVLLNLMTYLYPKRRSVELTSDSSTSVQAGYSREERIALLKDPEALRLSRELGLRLLNQNPPQKP